MKFLSYIVLFVLHSIVWIILFLGLIYFLAFASEIIFSSFANYERASDIVAGLILWSCIFALWLSFKSVAYSAGQGESFLTAMKLSWLETKNHLSGLIPWKN